MTTNILEDTIKVNVGGFKFQCKKDYILDLSYDYILHAWTDSGLEIQIDDDTIRNLEIVALTSEGCNEIIATVKM